MVKILIIQHKMIGDVLICSLLCKNIKLWNPDAKIDFVANRHTLDVIETDINKGGKREIEEAQSIAKGK